MVKGHIKEKGIYYNIKNKNCTKVAGFDLDHTLLRPKNNRVFPLNKNDWELLYKKEISVLHKLHNEDYKIVIFTNQGGISKGKTKLNNIIYKIDAFINKIGIPIDYMIAYEYNEYRKPNIGMWNIYKKYSMKRILRKNSFYCGDAAGRYKDFSDNDKKFADNIGIQFYLPGEVLK